MVVESLLAGRYQLVRLIGAGGMGRVFQAVDTESGRTVAAKVMIATGELELSALLRFQQEGAVLATLKHPNIVEVLATFLIEDTSCIIMEFLEGSPLSHILRTERLDLARIKGIVLQVLAALEYAHSRGIVHRDIKPDNILVGGNDHVKVTDFGIARIVSHEVTIATKTGMAIGTPTYMAPEQIEAQPVDGRADLYALGVVMYQMVTGHPPFGGEDPLSVAFKHVHKPPPPPHEVKADIPQDWEELILRALAKDPNDRYQTAASMSEALSALAIPEGFSVIGKRVGDTPTPDSMRLSSPGSAIRLGPGWLTEEQAEPSQASTSAGVPTGTGVPAQSDVQTSGAVAAPGFTFQPWMLIVAGVLVLLVAGGIFAAFLHSSSNASPATPTAVAPTPLPTTGSGKQPSGLKAPISVFGAAGSGAGQLRDPRGVTIDGNGNVYVADAGNNRIDEFTPSGSRVSFRAGLNHPRGVALGASGNLFVADTGNSRIVELSPHGKLLASWDGSNSQAGRLSSPDSIAVAHNGTIYVADSGNHRIVIFDASGKVLTFWDVQGSQAGQFLDPVSVAVDSLADVYVADAGNDHVQELASTSDPIAQWPPVGSTSIQLRRPRAVTIDGRGRVFIVDTGHDRVVVFSSSGKQLAAWGAAGAGKGQFSHPQGIAVDHQGNIYVVDSGNNRVQEFSPIG